jgi:hypothetical protein
MTIRKKVSVVGDQQIFDAIARNNTMIHQGQVRVRLSLALAVLNIRNFGIWHVASTLFIPNRPELSCTFYQHLGWSRSGVAVKCVAKYRWSNSDSNECHNFTTSIIFIGKPK